MSHEMDEKRKLAQFFFEVGFGSCWAEVLVQNGGKPPFQLTDAIIERGWRIAHEAHEDQAEWDRHQALADAAPDLLSALQGAIGALEFSQDYHRDLSNSEQAFAADKLDAARAAITAALGGEGR